MGRALGRRGHTAELVVLSAHHFGFAHDRRLRGRRDRLRLAASIPFRYDVCHYQLGGTFLKFMDAGLARAAGRVTLMHYWGSDCRLRDVSVRLHPARARVLDVSHGSAGDETRRGLERAGRVCCAAVVSDLELASYVLPYFRAVYLVPTPIELPLQPGDRPPALPGTGPVVFHAPSDPRVKGTAEIEATVQRLSQRVPLRRSFASGLRHRDVLSRVVRADIVIDQLNSETTGIFALEAMALGKPVLAEFNRMKLAGFARDTPAVPITPATLESELEHLCRDEPERHRLGRAGADFVRRVHDSDHVAACLERLYEHARSRPRGFYEATADGVHEVDPATADPTLVKPARRAAVGRAPELPR